MTTIDGTPAWTGVGTANWDGIARPDDMRLVSASSIVKVLAAPALEKWAIDTTAQVTVDNLSKVADILNRQGTEAAVNWVAKSRWLPRAGAALSASATGTLIHDIIECWGRGLPIGADKMAIVNSDPVIRAMLDRAWEWFQAHQPAFVRAECVVFDPANGVAGRFDQHWVLDDLGLTLIDIKTTRDTHTAAGNKKRPYADQHALQLATYRHAPLLATFDARTTGADGDGPRFYLLSPPEVAACEANPSVENTAILHITPGACGLYPVDTSEAVHERAKAAALLHGWLYREARKAIGPVWGMEAVA